MTYSVGGETTQTEDRVVDLNSISSTPQLAAASRKPARQAAEQPPAEKAPAESFEKSAPDKTETVKMTYLPQDPGVLPVAIGEMPAPQDNLANDRLRSPSRRTSPSPSPTATATSSSALTIRALTR